MDIGVLGTGDLAGHLGRAWSAAGHRILITGRRDDRAQAVAERIDGAEGVAPGELAGRAEVVVVAIAWAGLAEAMDLVGGPQGTLAGKAVVDCTNPVDFASGRMLLASGSAAGKVAELAAGAHVVKALQLFAGASWPYTGAPDEAPVVGLCGDDAHALDQVAGLIGDLGAGSAVLGGLEAARQSEEVAGFVMRLVAAGVNPRRAVPEVRRGPSIS